MSWPRPYWQMPTTQGVRCPAGHVSRLVGHPSGRMRYVSVLVDSVASTRHPHAAAHLPSQAGLVLNFVPDQRAALAEMARVTGNGGTIGAYIWDYTGKMELMRIFWDTAVELNPDAARMEEGVRFPLCHPEALMDPFASTGFHGVEVTAIDIPTPFASFDEYWRPFLGGQGPAPTYAMSLNEPARARLRDCIRERLPVEADGSISLTARAWAIRAT